MENFRPGTLERYGLDCETLQSVNPTLIILRVSGYGLTGPLAQQPGFARIAEAYSGLTYICGEPDTAPMHLGYPIADAVTGQFGAIGILIACYRKLTHPDAPGEIVDVSLVESTFRLLEFLPIEYDQLGEVRERSGNRSQYAGPSNVYRSRDGHWISMSASAQRVFERLAEMIGRPDLIIDDRFATNAARVRNAETLDTYISAWFADRDASDILETLARSHVSGGKVNSIADIFKSEQMRAREAIVYAEDEALGPVAMSNVVPRMVRAPGAVRTSGPSRGRHSEEFWTGFAGLNPAHFEELRQKQVI